MTPREFKAWFDGFTEAMDDKPTAKQWARVKERVAEIDGKTVTEKVYVDRYVPYRERYHNYGPIWSSCNTMSGASNIAFAPNIGPVDAESHTTNFDSLRAMAQLGQADAAALRA